MDMSKKVLVVEDHHDTSFMLCRLLKMEGYEVEHAIDGMVGFNTAATDHPDLIVTDINMPRMNGIEMIKRIREGEDTDLRETPIIVMSAYGRRMIDDALRAGADGFIEKPIDFDKFLTTVKEKMPTH
ncbi:MAG TPA: response regulator [Blastocatellia bacterium]|nr:response regulator [Blastocatellia bacterium]